MSKSRNIKPIIGLAAVCAFAVAIGIWVGTTLVQPKQVIQSENPVVENAKQKFEDILMHVEKDYVDEADLQALSETAIVKMLEQLDPHTSYITAKELALKNVELQGELEGIGIEFVMFKDTAYIVAPITGGPAEEAGLRAGDRIIKVDDEDFAGKGLKDIDLLERLRGTKGTKVKLTVKRNDQEELLDFVVTREKVPFYSIISYMVNGEVGYMNISRFTANTYKEFKTALSNLQKQGMCKLLIDLRSNPGGYIEKAIKVVNKMLDKGQLIVYTKGKINKYNTKHYAKGEDDWNTCPVIVLIDEGTASAAEIFAGALQDNDRALIVGRRSFGKGLVQVPIQLGDGSQLRLTVARYYTPSGRFIQKPYKEGITDYYTDLIERYKQGEYFRADNIQFDDAVKYQTSRGRIIYGGGGIMPDYFIPLDMGPSATYLKQIKHVLQHYALAYVDQHIETLTAMGYEAYFKIFEVTDLMLGQLRSQAALAGVPCDDKLFSIAKPRLKLHLKAHIANKIWGKQEFYPIYHQDDDVLQKALQLFDEAETLIKAPAIEEE